MIIVEFFTDLECTKPATKVGDLIAVRRRSSTLPGALGEVELGLRSIHACDRPTLGFDNDGTPFVTFEGSPIVGFSEDIMKPYEGKP